jgi:hypothetical protein
LLWLRGRSIGLVRRACGWANEAEYMETPRERVISISLNETDWQAFVRLHPQPVTWLRERIQESLQGVVDAPISAPLSASAGANTTSATTR